MLHRKEISRPQVVLAILAILCCSAVSATEKQTYVYKTIGALNIEVDVYCPEGTGKFPTVLMFHGGALISGNRNLNPKLVDRYIDHGYAVASVDYRLAPETKASGIFEDIRDAWRWLRTEKSLCVDINRIAVSGGSAGAYLALVSGYLFSPRPKAIVSLFGFGDPTLDWESKPWPPYLKPPLVSEADARNGVGGKEITNGNGKERGTFYLYCRQTGRWPQEVVGEDPVKNPRAFDRYCPVRNITGDYPPTMLWHGDHDMDVPYQQSVDMDAELTRRHVEHEFITIPGGGHGFPMTDERFAKLVEFLDKHLK